MSKIVIVNTSPRAKGNGAVITARLKDELTAKGAEVNVVDFRKSSIGYCRGCDVCMAHDKPWCVQRDDMTALLPEIDGCDALVLVSPIYWYEMSAQAKTFIDRMYAFFNPTKENMTVATKFGKKTAIVTTNGSMPVELAEEKAKAVAAAFAVAGFTENQVLCLNDLNVPGSVVDHEGYLDRVDELAEWLRA